MILNQKETTVSYRCPDCGSWVSGLAGMFSLSADMLRLKCPCGSNDELTLVYTRDKKLRFSVPCFICPKPHNFTVSQQVFFERELFALPCPYSGVDICYLGKREAVEAAQIEADNELRELMSDSDAGFSDVSDARRAAEGVLSDPQILEIVNFVIRDLDETGAKHCRCPQDEGVYTVDVTDDGICVSCSRCGAKTVIPVTSTISAQAFLNCESLELT